MAVEPVELHILPEDKDEESYYEYSLTSYPTDYTLAVVYEQWKAGEIVVPDFQRAYVWSIEQASRLIESFLIGLPIPQVFLYVGDDNKLIVIDGQQRITSIGYYFDGFFGPEHTSGNRKVFRLTGLAEKSPYRNLTFAELDASTQRKLRSAPLRAINIRQLRPSSDEDAEASSVYEIFERLNTGGTPLKPQEIRNAVFRGHLNDVLKSMNAVPAWRALLGKVGLDKHMRDVELLLRVFSLTYFRSSYDGKMKQFLNRVMSANKNNAGEPVSTFEKLFPEVADILHAKLPPSPFQRGGPINSAMLEAIFCACFADIAAAKTLSLKDGYKQLLKDPDFDAAISQSTNAADRVLARFELAKHHLFAK